MGVVIQQQAVNKAQAAKTAQQTGNKQQTMPETIVLVVLPPDQLANLRAGQPVTITAGAANNTFSSTIEQVETGVMNPSEVRTQFNLPAALAQVISGPAAIATVHVAPGAAMTYLGSQGQAQVQIGSENALSLLPGLNQLSMTNLTTIFTNIERFFLSLPGFFNTLVKH